MNPRWRSPRERGNNNKVSLWWKDLNEVWELEDWGRSFEDCFKWKVTNVKEIIFWKDNWVSCGALKGVFLRLWCFEERFSEVDYKLVKFGDWINSACEWNLAWRMRLFEWGKILESQLLQELQGLKIVLEMEDS